MNTPAKWAAILAGGNGTRLHSFTRAITGDDRPKQFCRLLSSETLLEATRARLTSLVSPDRTLCVVTEHHAPFYKSDLEAMPEHLLIEQPCNRGTAPAVAYAIARIEAMTPDAVVGLFPADHHFHDPEVLRTSALVAYAAANGDHDRVFLIGAEPDRPEPEYGYIQPSGPLPGRTLTHQRIPLRGVSAFVEKPSHAEAATLIRRGCLWNTFVMVGHLRAFASLIDATIPGLLSAFRALASGAGDAASLYAALPSTDFSRDVLSSQPDRLGLVPLSAGNWTDLGQPARVLEVMATRRPQRAAARAAS